MVDEVKEAQSFEDYYQKNKDSMDALSIEASWLALKGVCTVKMVKGGVRIDKVTDKYPVFMKVLLKHREMFKLSPEEQKKKMTELAAYAKMKLVG